MDCQRNPQTQRDQSNGQSRLLSLPAELRFQIYDYILPTALPSNIIHARYGGLRWLSASPRIFLDVAPLFYSKACLTAHAGAQQGSLVIYFDSHLRITYGSDQLYWIAPAAHKMIKHIRVDYAVQSLKDPSTVAESFERYFECVNRFSSLDSLHIRFHRNWKFPLWTPTSDLENENKSAMIHDRSLRGVLQIHVDDLEKAIPASCSLTVQEYGTWEV